MSLGLQGQDPQFYRCLGLGGASPPPRQTREDGDTIEQPCVHSEPVCTPFVLLPLVFCQQHVIAWRR